MSIIAKLYLRDGRTMERRIEKPPDPSQIGDTLLVAINEPIEEDGDVRVFSFCGVTTDDSGEPSYFEYRERKTVSVNGTRAGGSEAPR